MAHYIRCVWLQDWKWTDISRQSISDARLGQCHKIFSEFKQSEVPKFLQIDGLGLLLTGSFSRLNGTFLTAVGVKIASFFVTKKATSAPALWDTLSAITVQTKDRPASPWCGLVGYGNSREDAELEEMIVEIAACFSWLIVDKGRQEDTSA